MDPIGSKLIWALLIGAVMTLLLGFSTLEVKKTAAPKPKPKNPKQIRADQRRELKRQRTVCKFSDGVSRAKFAGIVRKAGQNVDRLDGISVNGTVVSGSVWDQSGKSKWKFCLDFNDYGHLTGRYWKFTENKGSLVPDYVGFEIQMLLQDCFNLKKTDFSHADMSRPVSYTGKKENKLLVTAAILVAAAAVLTVLRANRAIAISGPADAFIGLNGPAVVQMLGEEGFLHVRLEELEDLETEEKNRDGQIAEILVDGDPAFEQQSFLPYAEIVVRCHALHRISPTVSQEELLGGSWQEAAEKLSRDGFVNICPEPIPDLILGLLHREGDVMQITIGTDRAFGPDRTYRPDAEVRIRYHSLR